MGNDHAAELYRVLQKEAYNCTPEDFAEILKKFKNDPKAVEVMQAGVRHRMRGEDSGSYCEKASSGYYPTSLKQQMLDKHYLAQPLHTGGTLSAEFASVALAAILQKVEALEQKVATLEEHDKIKLRNGTRD